MLARAWTGPRTPTAHSAASRSPQRPQASTSRTSALPTLNQEAASIRHGHASTIRGCRTLDSTFIWQSELTCNRPHDVAKSLRTCIRTEQVPCCEAAEPLDGPGACPAAPGRKPAHTESDSVYVHAPLCSCWLEVEGLHSYSLLVVTSNSLAARAPRNVCLRPLLLLQLLLGRGMTLVVLERELQRHAAMLRH